MGWGGGVRGCSGAGKGGARCGWAGRGGLGWGGQGWGWVGVRVHVSSVRSLKGYPGSDPMITRIGRSGAEIWLGQGGMG